MGELCMATSTFDPARHPGEGPISATITETGDAPGSTATGYAMSVGDTFVGNIGVGGDDDWVATTLTAGATYEMTLAGAPSGSGTLSDPYLRLYNSSGTMIAFNDDGGPGLESLLTYTAVTTGTYYVSARHWSLAGTGTYQLTVVEDTPPPAPTPATLDQLADYLTDGHWNDISRSGRSWDTSSDNVITVNLTGLTAAGQQLARWALEAWEMVANLDFVETGGSADITFDDNASGAYASSTTSGGTILSSVINVGTGWLSSYGTTMDSYSFQTYIHEIGHALGLGHQGGYNGAATYGVDETFSNDSWQISIMSYFSQTQNTTTNASYAFLLTGMMADIIAIQNLYGAPTSQGLAQTSGNTTWGANSNLGNYLDDFFATLTGSPNSSVNGGSAVAYTIYDRGGVDTLNTTYSNSGDRISLASESFSDMGGGIGNVGIARGTVIENATTGNGNDTVTGNWAGNLLLTNGGDDSVLGLAGWDRIWTGSGNDTAYGGDGNDTLGGEAGMDELYGGNGNDLIFGGADNDIVGGGAGNDSVLGGSGNDQVWGATGNDTLRGEDGSDTVGGGDGHDLMFGGNGADTMWGGSGNDIMYGDGWADELSGGWGNDIMYGGNGNDTLWGSNGNDTLNGGDNNDLLGGGSHNDVLNGGGGADTLLGSWGNDTLDGGWGNDSMTGGNGADTFVFGVSTGNDTVSDFSLGENDRLQLDDALWTGTHGTLTAAQVLSTFGTDIGGNLVLNFGSQVITLIGHGSTVGLETGIDIF